MLTDDELYEYCKTSNDALEYLNDTIGALLGHIGELTAERDEYKHRYQNVVDIYVDKKYDDTVSTSD